MGKRDLTAEWLREHYHYEPESGILYRTKLKNGIPVSPMKRAGVITNIGYRSVRIGLHTYSEHELIYLWMEGRHKDGYMDHLDGVRDNNKWANLRVVSQKVNNQNVRRAQKNNKLGILGVCYCPRLKKYVAQITINRKAKNLGLFKTPEEAQQAYLKAKRIHHEGCTI